MINYSNLQYKYYIETWGCQMNEEDSEKISGILENIGYIRTDSREQADIILFNTCCVRENAENKVYGNLGELKTIKKNKPNLIICICGCMMQERGIPEIIKKKYPFVDIIFGTHNIHRLPELISDLKNSRKSITEIWDKEGDIIEGMPLRRQNDLKAFVTIMHGCNNFCTYCIVPYTRGRERSRKPEDIIEEIKILSKKGYKEITLLGQNVNSYGKDLDNMSFAMLLRMVNEVEGIERIRFMTSHPKDLTMDVILAIKDCNKVCKHIHLPLQSGSTRVLNLMNRKYTKEEYLHLIETIKSEIKNVSLTTDIIVGFPGETDDDFNETLDVVEKIKYDSAFTFIYSIRKGTPAANFTDQIPENIKHQRFDKLLKLINGIGEEISNGYVGRTIEVLVEGKSKTDENKLTGRTDNGKLVHFTGGDINLRSKIVNVKIIDAQMYTLIGEFVNVVK